MGEGICVLEKEKERNKNRNPRLSFDFMYKELNVQVTEILSGILN
jgi:hypothetical protein